MAQTFEYILSLQDRVSSKVKYIIGNTEVFQKTIGSLQDKSNKYKEAIDGLGYSMSTLKQKIDLLKTERDIIPLDNLTIIRKYTSEINKLEGMQNKIGKMNGTKVGGWFKDALNSIPPIITNPITLIGATVGGAMKKGMESDMQKSNILTLLHGDAEKAKSLFSDITKYAIKSPYEKSDLIDGQKTMMQFGIGADESFKRLQQIGDIAMGDSGKMQSLSLAFSQATSAGKLQGQDLLQMINAGFNPLNVISERTGESMAHLKERMEKGGISAKELGQAFEWATDKQGLFYQGAEKAGETMGGKWSTLLDGINELLLKIYDLISPLVMPLIELVTTALNGIGDVIGWVVDKFKTGDPIVRGLAIAIGIITTAIILYNTYLAITEFLQNKLTWAVIQSNLAFLANPVVWIIAAIIALIAVIVWLVTCVGGWGEAWDHVVKGSKLLWEWFVESIKAAWNDTIDIFMIGLDKIKEGWYKFKNAVGLGDKSANDQALLDIKADVDARAKAIVDNSAKLKKLAQDSGMEFVKAAQSIHITTSLTQVKEKVTGALLPGGLDPNAKYNSNGKGPVKDKAGKTSEAIATGGTKNTVVNITIGKTIESLNLYSTNVKEGAEKIRDIIVDELTRAIQMGGALAS